MLLRVMEPHFRGPLVVLIVLAACAFPSGILAQGGSGGSIAGTVTDPSGAVVPGAQIHAVEKATGTKYDSVTSSGGAFRIENAVTGTYDVTVNAAGFKQQVQGGLLVQVATLSPLNVTLQAGGATDVVTVDASAPTVQTETSDVGNVITTQQVIDLPLGLGGVGATRSPEAFVFLIPGTIGPGTNNGSGGVNQSKISGGQNYSTEVLLDGASTYLTQNGSSFDQTAPSVEAISQFRVITSTMAAEYGRTTGGIETFATKGGTNDFHGAVFDILQNDAMNANNWFNNYQIGLAGRTPAAQAQFRRNVDKQNDYGVSLGGPVRIPKVYNGRDKTFFYFSWEQFKQSQGAVHFSTLPTQAERNGDLSSFLTTTPITYTPAGASQTANYINPCNGLPIYQGQIFDPLTTRTVGGTLCRDPYPNNVIPSGALDPVTQAVLTNLPLPQTTATQSNYAYTQPYQTMNTLTTVRIDQNLGSRNHAFFSYSSRENTTEQGGDAFPTAAGGSTTTFFPTHYYRVGENFTITPSLLNTLNLGYNRTQNETIPRTAGNNIDYPATLGITGLHSRSFPNFNFGEGFSAFGQSVDDVITDNGYRINEALTAVLGKHTFKIGTDLRYQIFEPNFRDHDSGFFNFGRGQTAATEGYVTQTGNGLASFLIGSVAEQNAIIYTGAPKWISRYWAVFLQDDWKVTPALTLNLGLRYDVDIPRYEAHGNFSNLSLTAPNPAAGGIPGAMVFAGTGAGRNGNAKETWANTWYKDIAPRVGFAWSPAMYGGNTAVHGGFAIYYGAPLYADNGNLLRTGFQATPDVAVLQPGFADQYRLRNGFPTTYAGTTQPTYAPPPSFDPSQVNNSQPYYLAPEYGRPSMTTNWSLDVQQSLSQDLILQIGYVGQRSTHLRSAYDPVDALPQQYFGLGKTLTQDVASSAAITAGVKSPYTGFAGNVFQALRPFPQFNGINTDCCLENLGQSSYNSLQVSLDRKFRNGLSLLAAYTWQKTFTDSDSALPIFATFAGGGSPQDPFNHKVDKSISDQDIPHTFVVSYLYQLPVGKGKKFLGATPVVSRVLGGIEIGGIDRYQSGQPLGFGSATGIPGIQNGIRYNRVKGQPLLKPGFTTSTFRGLTTSVFNQAALIDQNAGIASNGGVYSFGDMPRVTAEARSQRFLNEDFSLNKRTAITDRFTLLFQAQAFNTFNRHIFNRPDTSGPNSPTFGFINSLIDAPRLLQMSLRVEY